MSEKLDRIGLDRDRALKKRDEWDAKYKELDRKYKEQENCEIQTMVHAANLTPDQLAKIIALADKGILGVSFEQIKEDAEMKKPDEAQEEITEDYENEV